jgi:hypothetical protein|eukprot:6525162-Prymnesium_polylepis.1
MASGIRNQSFERIRHDCTRFREVAAGDPSFVMVCSAAWDYSRWWQDAGQPRDTSWCHGGLVDKWRSALADYLRLVRVTFRNATLIWRTDAYDHEAYSSGKFYRTSPECVGAMNQASRYEAHRQGYHIFDVASMLPKPRTAEGIHFADAKVMRAIWSLIFSFVKIKEREQRNKPNS